ncbi:SapB/AmfS family lanthipeptide [Streptomyces sp. HPF1205]|nr:SapB/AmfS family lanthipeptide [Streptomyces sp. HPF1205]
MALLDLQNLEPADRHNGGDGDSSLSLLSCVSSLSTLVCL